jgi:hypothetical protein
MWIDGVFGHSLVKKFLQKEKVRKWLDNQVCVQCTSYVIPIWSWAVMLNLNGNSIRHTLDRDLIIYPASGKDLKSGGAAVVPPH